MKNGSQNNLKPTPLLSLMASSDAGVVEVLGLLRLIISQGKIRPPKPLIKFPVFQGGGAKGAAYIGVYEALDEMGYLEEAVCPGGASAGAIAAFFMSLGFDAAQFRNITENLNFNDFIDFKKNGWSEYLNGYKVGNVIDLVRYGAVSPGKSFHQWASYYLEQVLGDKNATFRDLHEKLPADPTLKDVLFKATHYATRNDNQARQVFSFATTPDVVIADAFRASMSYPGAFEPWLVRQKEIIDGKVTYKSLGFFADGGILNNLPVSCYNREYFADANYQNLERIDSRNQPVKINPSVVGFSLTDLENLNDDISPMTERVKALQEAAQLKNNSAVSTAKTAPSSWHLMDIAKAALWNYFGKPEAEDIADKHKIYFDQTVQIWPENVTTLEFDLSREKLMRISDNGKIATMLWLKKFRNPADSYNYKQYYDDRLTKKEEKQKLNAPKNFYLTKLSSLFVALFNETKKQEKINSTEQGLISNVRIRYLASRILYFSDLALTEKVDVIKDAYTQANQTYQQREAAIARSRAHRWDIINPQKILDNICNKLSSEPKIAVKLVKSQLSNIISVAELNHGQLLRALVNTNNIELTHKVLSAINKALNQAYYHGKLTNPKCHMSKLLDNTNPSLLYLALQHNNLDMVDVLLNYGANIRHINVQSGKDGLEEAISLSNYAGFKKLVMECVGEEHSLDALKINQEELWQYIFHHASKDFIRTLCHDNEFLLAIANEHTDDNGMSILHHLALKGTSDAFANLSYAILADGVFSKAMLTDNDYNGESPLATIIHNKREDILRSLVAKGKRRFSGYLTTSDYFLDHVFDVQQDNRKSINDLKRAYVIAPKLYRYFMKHLSSQSKANELNNMITCEQHFAILDQPKSQINEVADIHQEPVMFNQVFDEEVRDTSNRLASRIKSSATSLVAL